ncbi:threonine aldolase [Spirochaetia bacterium]|nr:threonine aldolase [Spirochaetia bacterium]
MAVTENMYHFSGEQNIDSPALIYYQDIITANIKHAISMAGDAGRLWPHVKTHKMEAMIHLQMSMGIRRFKCATIAEAEMTARCGAEHILLAYPLIGPAIDRFIRLRERYARTEFWAIGDNTEQLALLGKAAGRDIPVLADINLGMDRTGVTLDKLEAFCLTLAGIPGLALKGFHGYDGHLGIKDLAERQQAVEKKWERLRVVQEALERRSITLPVLVMGGTPTFPCYQAHGNVFLSPGTLFVNDHGYSEKYHDLDFTPGAAILSRVISHPAAGLFTLDLGSKAIAADPIGERGVIAGLSQAQPAAQSEEHWVFRLEGQERPPIGAVLYVIPTHICPTTALYPGVPVVQNGRMVNYWEVTARNRKLSI